MNVCPRVVRYTLLNSIAPRNWEMTLKMPYAQNKEPAKKKLKKHHYRGDVLLEEK